MPTRLYFHHAEHSLTGTFPAGEQAGATPHWTADGASTLRAMDTNIGVAQVSRSGITPASTGIKFGFMGMWVSPPLSGAQTVGGGAATLNSADSASDAAANFLINALNTYVWRPSTGQQVGLIRGAAATDLGGSSGGTGETVTHITGVSTSAISAADGDVIICEVWARYPQDVAAAVTATMYYDGATVNTTENAAVSDHASFIEFAETLTFQGAALTTESRATAWRIRTAAQRASAWRVLTGNGQAVSWRIRAGAARVTAWRVLNRIDRLTGWRIGDVVLPPPSVVIYATPRTRGVRAGPYPRVVYATPPTRLIRA